MADMHLREKLKNLSEAVRHGDSVSERSKNTGLVVFLILFGCGIVVLFALAIGLVMNGHLVIGFVLVLIASLFAYSIVKMMTAADIRPL